MKLIDRTKLRRAMFTNKFSHAKLAEESGCSRASIYNKVNGVRDFSESETVNLLKLFGSSIFFTDTCHQIDNKPKN